MGGATCQCQCRRCQPKKSKLYCNTFHLPPLGGLCDHPELSYCPLNNYTVVRDYYTVVRDSPYMVHFSSFFVFLVPPRGPPFSPFPHPPPKKKKKKKKKK